jgi:hypothetical protein
VRSKTRVFFFVLTILCSASKPLCTIACLFSCLFNDAVGISVHKKTHRQHGDLISLLLLFPNKGSRLINDTSEPIKIWLEICKGKKIVKVLS